VQDQLVVNAGVAESLLVPDDVVEVVAQLNLLPVQVFKLFLTEDQIGVGKMIFDQKSIRYFLTKTIIFTPISPSDGSKLNLKICLLIIFKENLVRPRRCGRLF